MLRSVSQRLNILTRIRLQYRSEQRHVECTSAVAMKSGADGGILELLRDEVRRACDGSQEMSGWVVGGHSTAPREADGNNGVQREIRTEISSGIFYGTAIRRSASV
jgi:hypothetical protein